MAVHWSEEALAELERRGIEPALVQCALAAPDEIEPGRPWRMGCATGIRP